MSFARTHFESFLKIKPFFSVQVQKKKTKSQNSSEKFETIVFESQQGKPQKRERWLGWLVYIKSSKNKQTNFVKKKSNRVLQKF